MRNTNVKISRYLLLFGAFLLLLTGMAAAQLEIDDSSVIVEVNGEPGEENESGSIIAAPGDDVSISFTITNTGDGTLAHVSTAISVVNDAGEPIEDIELPEDHLCTEEDCSTGYWALPAGDSETETYTFSLPLDLSPAIGAFTVVLESSHDDGAGDNTILISFGVTREGGTVIIENAELRPSTLTCRTSAELRFNIVNTGEREFTPELRVYSREGAEFSRQRGVYDFTPAPAVALETSLNPIAPEDGRVPVRQSISTSGLGRGTHTLFVYLVSPFFGPDRDGFFVSDSAEITVARSACIITSSPAQSNLFAVQGQAIDFSVTLAEADSTQWLVDGTEQPAARGSTAFSASFDAAGRHTVEARAGGDSRTWTIDVGQSVEASLSVSEILLENVNRGTTVNATLTVTNPGTSGDITNLGFSFVGVNAARYAPRLLGTLPTGIPARGSVEVQLQLSIPADEASGRHSIGGLRVASDQDTETAAITISPRSFLTVSGVEIDGKEDGKLSVEDDNEIEVEIRNDYTEDMEDVTVKVTLLDVGGDDLEEESETFDLRTGRDEKVAFTFDLRSETADENEYVLEIEVEGDGEDGTSHRTIETRSITVDREKHRVIISKAPDSTISLQCIRQTSLQLSAKNVGQEEEDDVEIRVRNEALGFDLRRGAIELEDYTDEDDSEIDVSFSLNLEEADAGTYLLAAEVYLDGDLEDSREIALEVKDCAALQESTQTQEDLADQELTEELQEQLQQGLQARKEEQKQPSIASSLRESPLYVPLLGVLIVLVVVAGLLLIGVALKRRGGGKE